MCDHGNTLSQKSGCKRTDFLRKPKKNSEPTQNWCLSFTLKDILKSLSTYGLKSNMCNEDNLSTNNNNNNIESFVTWIATRKVQWLFPGVSNPYK
jgi:hypothetical protein